MLVELFIWCILVYCYSVHQWRESFDWWSLLIKKVLYALVFGV